MNCFPRIPFVNKQLEALNTVSYRQNMVNGGCDYRNYNSVILLAIQYGLHRPFQTVLNLAITKNIVSVEHMSWILCLLQASHPLVIRTIKFHSNILLIRPLVARKGIYLPKSG